MAINVVALLRNQTVPSGLAQGGLQIFSGIIECAFSGDANGNVVRDTLSFTVGRVNLGAAAPIASCVASPASFAYDGPASNLLWAVDSANVQNYTNEDRGSGTADLQVEVNLAVRGVNGVILRINYTVFYTP